MCTCTSRNYDPQCLKGTELFNTVMEWYGIINHPWARDMREENQNNAWQEYHQAVSNYMAHVKGNKDV